MSAFQDGYDAMKTRAVQQLLSTAEDFEQMAEQQEQTAQLRSHALQAAGLKAGAETMRQKAPLLRGQAKHIEKL